MTKRKPTKWNLHVKSEIDKKKNEGKPLSEILKSASKTYKK